jgi:hypothetical protein
MHYYYMILDEYFQGVHDEGPFYVIMGTDFWWLGGLYFFSFLMMYYIILTTDNSDFGWRSISFYTIGHIVMTIIAVSISNCSSVEVTNISENGVIGIVLSLISMILLRGITIGNLLKGGVSHVSQVMHTANDKRLSRELEEIASIGPAGKKAVDDLLASQKSLKIVAEEASGMASDRLKEIKDQFNLKNI